MKITTRKARGAGAALVLAAALALTACGTDATPLGTSVTGTAVAESGNDISTTGSKTAACKLLNASMQEQAGWDRTGSAPHYALIVTEAIDLPSQFSALTQRTEPFDFGVVKAGIAGGLIQDTDGVVYAMVGDRDATGARSLHMAKFVDGRLTGTETTTTGGEVSLVEENEDSFHGYGGYRVIAADGIDVPAAVSGPGEQYRYLTSTLVDADGENVWFFAAGSDKLYQARAAKIDAEATLDEIDVTACK